MHGMESVSESERSSWVRVRDIARKTTHVLPAEREMLRVPYDLARPTGPVEVKGEFATYRHGDEETRGRVARARLADAQPGETVLLRLAESSAEPEWWGCE